MPGDRAVRDLRVPARDTCQSLPARSGCTNTRREPVVNAAESPELGRLSVTIDSRLHVQVDGIAGGGLPGSQAGVLGYLRKNRLVAPHSSQSTMEDGSYLCVAISLRGDPSGLSLRCIIRSRRSG